MLRSRTSPVPPGRLLSHVPALALAVALAALLAGAGSAQAATLTQRYSCMYPLIGIRSEVLTITGDFPASSPINTPIPTFPLAVKLTSTEAANAFEPVVQAKSATADLKSKGTLTNGEGVVLPLSSSFALGSSSAESDGSVSLSGVWNFPSLNLTVPGPTPVTFDRFTLNQRLLRADGSVVQLRPSTKDIDGNPTADSDGNPDTFDVSCKPYAGEPTGLGQFNPFDPAIALTQTVKCAYPVFGIRGATLTVSGQFPATSPVSEPTPQIPLAVKLLPHGGKSFEPVIMATTGEAELTGKATITSPFGASYGVTQRVHLDARPGIEGAVALAGTWNFPSFFSDDLGKQPVTLGKFTLIQTLRNDAGEVVQMPELKKDVDGTPWRPLDTNPDTFDVSCWPDAGQPTKIGEFNFVEPNWTHAFTATGSSALPRLVQGTVPLKGSATLAYSDAGKTVTSNDLVFAQSKARLLSLAATPVVARVGFVRAGPVSGTLVDGALTLTVTVRIKVLDASLYGAVPIATGNSCQSKQLSTITLKSTGAFTPESGGTLTGTFPISDLNGCELLNGLVSPLTASSANTISLKLAPAVAVAAGG